MLYEVITDVVLGVGGYVTGPVVAMAKMLGIPTLIHEQNSIPGLANRKLGTLVDRVCISLPDSGNLFRITSYNVCYTKLLRKIVETDRSNRDKRQNYRHLSS